jgi:Cu/Ag efflux protein CusF
MNKLMYSAAFGASLVAASPAFAATDTGVIKSVDLKGDAITLEDGKVFVLAEGTEAESLKAGEKVTVTFRLKGGKVIVTKVQPAK